MVLAEIGFSYKKKSIAESAASPLSAMTEDQWPAKLPFVFLSEISNNHNGYGNK